MKLSGLEIAGLFQWVWKDILDSFFVTQIRSKASFHYQMEAASLIGVNRA